MRVSTMRHVIHRLCIYWTLALPLTNNLHGQSNSLTLPRSHQGAPVVLDGDTLFVIRANLGPFAPDQRAAAINEKLRSIIKKGRIDSVVVAESAAGSNIGGASRSSDGWWFQRVVERIPSGTLPKPRKGISRQYSTSQEHGF
jgi:hypothetical protein